MNRISIAFLLTMLSGCSPMTNDQIIVEVEKCRAADLIPHLYYDGLSRPEMVICTPKEQP